MALRSGGVQIVFAFLTKGVVFHVRIVIVQVGIPYFQGPVRGFFLGIYWRGCWSRSGSGIPAVFQIGLHELPKQVLSWRFGRSSCGRSRCSKARCSRRRCSKGGAWSGKAKACLGDVETTRLGGSSRATRGGSPWLRLGRSPGNTLGDGSLHRGLAAEGSHLVRWQGGKFFTFQTSWLNRWWNF